MNNLAFRDGIQKDNKMSRCRKSFPGFAKPVCNREKAIIAMRLAMQLD